MFKGFRDY
ncbi:hypothetical protein R9D24_00010, partial [Chlamydia crocodili]